MVLPPQICFRSAGPTEPDDDLDCLGGYCVQYDISGNIVNVVILSMRNTCTEPLPEEEQLLEKLDEAATVSNDDDGDGSFSAQEMDCLDRITDEILEWIESKCESTLLQLLSSVQPRPEDTETTLKTLLSPNIINLQVKTVNGDVTVIRHDSVPPWPKEWHLGHPFGLAVQLPVKAGVVRHDASEMVIVERHAVPIVSTKNQNFKLRCKLNMNAQSTLREYNIYRDLSRIKANHEFRIPAFYGCVTDGDDSKVVALLIEDIQVQSPTLDHAMGYVIDVDILQNEVNPTSPITAPPTAKETATPSIDRRRKWARQIRHIMQILHENDIVWGDVKPANVVIDVDDDAWAIDFGGGFTMPWKNSANAETMLGDLSALCLIEEYLETGKQPSMLEKSYSGVDDVNDENNDNNQVEAAVTTMQSQGSNQAHGEEKAHNTKRKHGSCSPG